MNKAELAAYLADTNDSDGRHPGFLMNMRKKLTKK